MSQQYSVEFTVGVLEKLAGMRKPPASKQTKAPSSRPHGNLLNPEAAALARSDAQLNRALQSSRQVGDLLLKQEEEELLKIRAMSDKMAARFASSIKHAPCEEQRLAVLGCYEADSDPLRCSSFVKAYSACTQKL
jgi:hypothetical protein